MARFLTARAPTAVTCAVTCAVQLDPHQFLKQSSRVSPPVCGRARPSSHRWSVAPPNLQSCAVPSPGGSCLACHTHPIGHAAHPAHAPACSCIALPMYCSAHVFLPPRLPYRSLSEPMARPARKVMAPTRTHAAVDGAANPPAEGAGAAAAACTRAARVSVPTSPAALPQ